MPQDWMSALGPVLPSVGVALATVLLLAVWQRWRPDVQKGLFALDMPETIFLFDGERLLDATPAARALLPGEDDSRAWPCLLGKLHPMFPGLAQRLGDLPGLGQVLLTSAPGIVPPIVLKGEGLGGLTRLTLIDTGAEQRQVAARAGADSGSVAALHQEVMAQRALLAQAPVLIWREAQDGAVIWANHAYLIRAAELLPPGEDLSWPLPNLFAKADPGQGGSARGKLQLQTGAEWFDLVRVPLKGEAMCYALAANTAVQAETALRNFMQTLTKTFADLPIGLAIFDRARMLQLFNPALTDLTTLSPDFLISRPTLASVLDAMRAKAMLPEPRDYRSWRRQLTKLEEESLMGVFEEIWSLPGGQTYRVIGRPHPNGALALMFEDISTEITRTRRYRADLELGQSVIDAVDEAVAVFSQGGQLVMSNVAYARLWNHDPAVLLSDAGIGTLSVWWREHSAPTLLWDDATDFVSTLGDRTAWEGEVRLLDGRLVACRFKPLAGGATLITFSARRPDIRTAPLELTADLRTG